MRHIHATDAASSELPRTALSARLGAVDSQLGREILIGAVLCDLNAGQVHHPRVRLVRTRCTTAHGFVRHPRKQHALSEHKACALHNQTSAVMTSKRAGLKRTSCGLALAAGLGAICCQRAREHLLLAVLGNLRAGFPRYARILFVRAPTRRGACARLAARFLHGLLATARTQYLAHAIAGFIAA